MVVWDFKVVWCFMSLLAGAAADVGVNYPDHVCAVKGSTVTLPCTFTPLTVSPSGIRLEIIRVRWCQNHTICHLTTPSVYDSDSQNNKPRYKYLGDKKRNCTLQITDIQKSDQATLRFRMEANDKEGHYTDQSGVEVTVTDETPLTITSSSDDRVMRRGEGVTLFCTALCTFHQLELTWFKDDHALSESGPALHLNHLSAKDSGNYTCRLKPSAGAVSLPYSLQVEAEEEETVTHSSDPSLIVGVVFVVLLALFILIMVYCIIRRRRAAADGDHRPDGGEAQQKHPDNIYSNMVLLVEREEGSQQQETRQDVEDVSYASVQFKHSIQERPAVEVNDAIIYSSVANRG